MAVFKKKEEIDKIKETGRRHAEVMRKTIDLLAPGVSTLTIDDFVRDSITANGPADRPSFLNYTPKGAYRPYPASCNISINEEIVHGIPNEKPKILKDGDIVSLDIGYCHDGFYTDMAVTVPVGKVDDKGLALIEATREVLYAGIDQAKLGGRVGDIGFAIESLAKKKGYAIAEGLCGHGVGRSVHEDPYVLNNGPKGKGAVLGEGMVVAIEPMLNEGTAKNILLDDGYTIRTADMKRSAHFEHTILITADGPVILTEL